MTIYGYARVSTQSQELTEQINELKRMGVDESNIFAEKMTGTKENRPEWQHLMGVLVPNDELVVTKLDRLGRSLRVILKEVEELEEKGVVVRIGNMTYDDSPQGHMMLNIMATFAEFERDMIVSRMQEGREFAREHNQGYREGRKRKLTDELAKQMQVYYQTHTRKETAKAFGVSEKTVSNYCKKTEL